MKYPGSHHIVAEFLNRRRDLLEQIDGLVGRLVKQQIPALSPEDQTRLTRIRADLLGLYTSTQASYDQNRTALRELVATKSANAHAEAASEGT